MGSNVTDLMLALATQPASVRKGLEVVECIPTSVYFPTSIRVRKVPPLLALRMGGSSGVFPPGWKNTLREKYVWSWHKNGREGPTRI